MNYAQLIDLARQAREHAYAPYSRFQVGAALLTASGRIYTGCNIENVALSPSICAERTAIFKAVSEGERKFVAIAIVSQNGIPPCGTCRQVMMEFAPGIVLVIADLAGDYRVTTLDELFPSAFTPSQLPR
ncbi:MAG: cytidine deaminase [Anaerolineae bacterium]|nr:cytidine deaminase [Anaerolineae bacterium]MDW8070225.1 cytidine deaminase [Anaerolineae bacterium]